MVKSILSYSVSHILSYSVNHKQKLTVFRLMKGSAYSSERSM